MAVNEPKKNALHGDEQRERERKRWAKTERDDVDRILEQSFSSLMAGDWPNPVSEGLVTFLFESVCAGSKGHLWRTRHNHLVTRLNEIARKHQLTLPNRDLITVVRMDTPSATPRSFAHKNDFEQDESAFWATLETGKELDDAERLQHDAGRLVFSMVWFGGLHARKLLHAVCDALGGGVETAPNLVGGRKLHWLECEGEAECLRWFPDPVTLCLLHRFYREHGLRAFPGKPSLRLAEFVSRISPAKGRISDEELFTRNLMDAASTNASLEVMGVVGLLQNAAGVSAALAPPSWVRLVTGRIPKKVDSHPQVSSSELITSPPACPLYGKGKNGKAIEQIRQALMIDAKVEQASKKSKSYKSLQDIANASDTAPIVRVLASWSANLRLSLKSSSILRYLSEFAGPLIAEIIDCDDLNDLDEDEWEILYANLLAVSTSTKQLAYRSGVLRRFHRYLVVEHGLPDTYIEGASSNGQVDAEILSPAEFARALSMLDGEPDQRLSQARQIALILGYRCGLRRGEVRRLLLRDFKGLHEPALRRPTLTVRGNRFLSKKTPNANRHLPLWALLTDDELDLVRLWYRRRISEQTILRRDRPIFCELHQPDRLMPAEKLIKPVRDAIRIASGTPTMRFHHLRHSCASFSALRLLESFPGQLFPKEWACSDDREVIMPHWGRHWFEVLYAEDHYFPARDRIQFLTIMMGHASPGQTIRTYAHILDYALGVMRWSALTAPLSNLRQAELLGFNEDYLNRWRPRRGLKGDTNPAQLASDLGRWAKGAEKTVGKKFEKFKPVDLSKEVESKDSTMPPSALLIYRALDRIAQLTKKGAKLERAIASTAELCALPEATITLCYRRGEWLMSQHARNFTEERPGQRNAFSLGKTPNDHNVARRKRFGGVNEPVQTRCPAPPKLIQSHATIETLYQGLVKVADSDPEHFRSLVENVVRSSQRSHTHLSFRDTESKIRYLSFLEIIGFLPLAWVDVRAPENGPDERQMRLYWSEKLSLPESRIRVRWNEPAGPHNSMGVAQIEFDPPSKGFGKNPLQHAMAAVRFVAFVSLIGFAGRVYVDEKLEQDKKRDWPSLARELTYSFIGDTVLPLH
ncbi:hypothetical protein [Marinobacter adhaerens]|jgi:integrase|uniref:hypothetical protein n=1 Tax=Marinobacter adhaerens TaxID=1033846 RepID=UPI003BACB924